MATWLFVQQFVEAYEKKSQKLCIVGPLYRNQFEIPWSNICILQSLWKKVWHKLQPHHLHENKFQAMIMIEFTTDIF